MCLIRPRLSARSDGLVDLLERGTLYKLVSLLDTQGTTVLRSTCRRVEASKMIHTLRLAFGPAGSKFAEGRNRRADSCGRR